MRGIPAGLGFLLLPLLLLGCAAPRPVDEDALEAPMLFGVVPKREEVGGVAVDVLQRADEDRDGRPERSLELIEGGDLVVHEWGSNQLRRIPLDGGQPSVIASTTTCRTRSTCAGARSSSPAAWVA